LSDQDDSFLKNIAQPRVLLVEPVALQEFAVLNEDIIEMSGTGDQAPLSYQFHLAGVRDENVYFIMGAHDLIQVPNIVPTLFL